MYIKTKGDVTTIRFLSKDHMELAKFLIFLILLFFGTPLVLIGKILPVPPFYWNSILIFFGIVFAGIGFIAFFEKKIEIHPDRIFVKNSMFGGERVLPVVPGKMAILFENFPFIQVCIPRENWQIYIGYEDKTLFLTEDIDRQEIFRQIVSTISTRFCVPVIDYTYADQTDTVLFLKPEEVNMPFSLRAVKFPQLLMLGESPGERSIFEEIVSNRNKSYSWTTFTWYNIIRTSIIAGAFAVLVMIGVIGVNDSLVDIKFMGENRNIYNLIFVVYLGSLAYYSGIKKTLDLIGEKLVYTLFFLGKVVYRQEFEIAKIQEVRMKPTPGGFTCKVMDEKRILTLKTHTGGLNDFANLLWLTEKIQSYILENREATIKEEMICECIIEEDRNENEEPAPQVSPEVQEKPDEV
ncbi:MAG: hypothetical protein LWY06_17815 [Firmicutes bacterium]|nr:hypothetical protein [Bacillota bacterium]